MMAREKKAKADSLDLGRDFTVETGALGITGPDGRDWQSAACGDHRSVAIAERASDEIPEPAAGFQPDCEACCEQASGTRDYALTHSSV